MKRNRRRGRPPKPGPREPNGRLLRSVRDSGTDELQARRKWLADQTQCSHPIGILATNGAITETERDAVGRLAWLWSVVHGVVSKSAVEFERGYGRTVSRDPDDPEYDAWLANREAELRGMLRQLDGVSRKARDEIVRLAVYEEVPHFMRPTFPIAGDWEHAERIRRGITTLVADKRTSDALRAKRA